MEISYQDDGASTRLTNGLITLDFDKITGYWLALTDENEGAQILHGGDLLSPLLLTVGGHALATRDVNQLFSVADSEMIGLNWQLQGAQFFKEDAGGWYVVTVREGPWLAEFRHGLRPGSRRVERRLSLQYEGDGEVLLRSFTLRFPFASLGPASDCYLEAPGYPVRPRSRVSSIWHGGWGALSEGAFSDAPAWRPPFVGMHNPSASRSLAVWAWTESEPFFPHAERSEAGVMFSHRVYLADRFRKDHRLEWGAQYFEVFPVDWMAALPRLQGFYDEVGFATPADVPDWARAVDMYEVHVGTLSGTSLAPYPTYEPLIEDLPRIKEKGFEVVYIMPHVPFPSYSVIDYLDLDIHQGSAEGFRQLIQSAHGLGMKVLMDVTIHGVMDQRAWLARSGRRSEEPVMPKEHPYLKEHPEWFSRNEAGQVATTYTYAFDHANSSWQDFMAQVFAYYVKEYDVDGFRVDSHTWNFFPNWARELPYPASDSFYGSARLFQRIRNELKAMKPEVVFYTETAGPLLHASHELGYNYDETWMLVNMLPMASRRGILCHGLQSGHVSGGRMGARDLATWLAQRRLAMPRGAIKVRSLDNHDTYWPSHEFRRETFGPDAARAIVALFAFLDGGFMDYNGADEGEEEFYRKIMRLRQLPTLKRGTCDYLAIEPSERMVFAPLWEYDGRYLLPVIHLDKRHVTTTLPLPVEQMSLPADHYRVCNLMTDANLPGPADSHWTSNDLKNLSLELDPYGITLLDFAPAKPA